MEKRCPLKSCRKKCFSRFFSSHDSPTLPYQESLSSPRRGYLAKKNMADKADENIQLDLCKVMQMTQEHFCFSPIDAINNALLRVISTRKNVLIGPLIYHFECDLHACFTTCEGCRTTTGYNWRHIFIDFWIDLVDFDINNKQRQRRKQVTHIRLSDITSTYVSATNVSFGKLPSKLALICFVRKRFGLCSVFSRVNRHKKSKEFSTWFHIATLS